jgi:hypothetical protein
MKRGKNLGVLAMGLESTFFNNCGAHKVGSIQRHKTLGQELRKCPVYERQLQQHCLILEIIKLCSIDMLHPGCTNKR